MSDVAIATPTQPAVQHRATQLRGKLRAAIDAMVWQGLPRDEAAETAGMSVNGLYKALRKPAVKAHYLAELEVLRTSERARNIHALVDVRAGSNAMARVAAVKALEQMDENTSNRGLNAPLRWPGMVIQIINQPPLTPHYQQIEAKPLQTNTIGPTDGVGRDD